jgi:hypothetical protein
MARKKSLNIENQGMQENAAALQDKTVRERKIMNLTANTSIILMSTMMGAFTKVMMDATGAMASGMVAAIGGKEAEEEVTKEIQQGQPGVDEKVKTLISDVRKDVYAQLAAKSKKTQPLLADPAFDVGLEIVEKYDFGLLKLTEELDDNALAQYVQLLVSEDASFVEMFKELTSWMSGLPEIPEKTITK